jgi:hypothetical protein
MVGGYVWARYSYYGSTLIALALTVNTHFWRKFFVLETCSLVYID